MHYIRSPPLSLSLCYPTSVTSQVLCPLSAYLWRLRPPYWFGMPSLELGLLLLLAALAAGDVDFKHHNNTMLAATLQKVGAINVVVFITVRNFPSCQTYVNTFKGKFLPTSCCASSVYEHHILVRIQLLQFKPQPLDHATKNEI